MVDLPCRPVLLAAALARRGARVVVVGGTARWLRHGGRRPLDLDVCVRPDAVAGLVSALEGLGATATGVLLLRSLDVRVDTPWGPLDVFVADVPASSSVAVQGIAVDVEVLA